MNFKYRTTEIKENKWIVVSALFKFGFGFDKAASEDKREQRKMKHPLDLPNLGSTFKNPEGKFAARLISDADLKGYRVGDATVSTKHPNFVTNLVMPLLMMLFQLLNMLRKLSLKSLE